MMNEEDFLKQSKLLLEDMISKTTNEDDIIVLTSRLKSIEEELDVIRNVIPAPDWDSYFMTIVYLAATRSKDLNTHIGAVIVRPDNTVVSMGYNSFPKKAVDNNYLRQVAPEKYFWMEHAERNAIYNAKCDLSGYKMYTQGVPCMDCARAIVQSGIKEVIVDQRMNKVLTSSKWVESAQRSKELFKEVGVTVREWQGNLVTIYGLIGGKKV